MKYAVIATGGKQYKVQEGDVIELERLTTPSESFLFDKVLLVSDGSKITIGNPLISGAIVKAKFLGHAKGEKIRVATYKAKVRQRKVRGHRQSLSRVQIETINLTQGSQRLDRREKKA